MYLFNSNTLDSFIHVLLDNEVEDWYDLVIQESRGMSLKTAVRNINNKLRDFIDGCEHITTKCHKSFFLPKILNELFEILFENNVGEWVSKIDEYVMCYISENRLEYAKEIAAILKINIKLKEYLIRIEKITARC